jgi:hypothetical protein
MFPENEHQKIFFFLLGVKHGRSVKLTASPLSVNRLSRKCGILDVSKPSRPSWAFTGIAFTFFT